MLLLGQLLFRFIKAPLISMSNLRLIDTHAHLDFPEFAKDLDEVIQRARESGVETIITIGTDLASSRKAIVLSQRYPNIFATVGIHPHETKHIKDTDLPNAGQASWSELEQLVDREKVVGIGEIGLDFYKDYSPHEVQKTAFIRQLRIARNYAKPIIIHSREAHQDCLEILRNEMGEQIRGVAHCFSGSTEVAKEYLKLGFYISVAGPVTFPTALKLRKVVKNIPVERLLLETDSPFLAPQPKRGKRNEPAYLVYCVEEFSRIYGLSVDEIARITTLNARKLFGINISVG